MKLMACADPVYEPAPAPGFSGSGSDSGSGSGVTPTGHSHETQGPRPTGIPMKETTP